MDLILWRHAEAEEGFPDAARKLTAEGLNQAKCMSDWLKSKLPKNTKVIASPTQRTQQTATALCSDFITEAAVGPELLVPDEIPVRFEMEQWTAEFQNGEWRISKHYSDDGCGNEILTKWIQLWQTARAEALKLENELDSDWIETGVIRISLQSGKVIEFKILQNKYSLVLLRMAEGIGYQFPAKLGQRLISPRAIVLNQ
jgi:broad specificity phosphatase PhoE